MAATDRARAAGSRAPAVPPAREAVRHIVCANCHVRNAVDASIPAGHEFCDRCGEPLFRGVIADLSPKRMRRHLDGSDIPVVVLFWSPESEQSLRLTDEFQLLARHLEPHCRFCRVDVSEHEDLARQFNVRRVPAVIVFDRRAEAARWLGEIDMPELSGWVRRAARLPPFEHKAP